MHGRVFPGQPGNFAAVVVEVVVAVGPVSSDVVAAVDGFVVGVEAVETVVDIAIIKKLNVLLVLQKININRKKSGI